MSGLGLRDYHDLPVNYSSIQDFFLNYRKKTVTEDYPTVPFLAKRPATETFPSESVKHGERKQNSSLLHEDIKSPNELDW